MSLQWVKVADCPDVVDCDCAEPTTTPTFAGQTTYTLCGGSSSSDSSDSSDSSGSSGSSPVGCGGTCTWQWQGTFAEGEWVRISNNLGCVAECACDQPPRGPYYLGEMIGATCY